MSLLVIPISLEEEYKKPTGITPEDIKMLREWVKTQPHLPYDLITDLDLIVCYHSCHKSMEVAKQVLDLNLTHKTHFYNICAKNRVVDQVMLKNFNFMMGCLLPERARDGSAVVYMTLTDWNPKKFNLPDCARAVIALLDLWQLENGTWPGLHAILDISGITLAHLPRLDLQTVQQIIYFLQDSIFVRLKAIHFQNAPSFMDKIMMILKPFMKKEFMELIDIHPKGTNTLDKRVPIKALPQSAGGMYKTNEEIREHIVAYLKDNSEYFVQENKKRVNETLRPGKPKSISDFNGSIEGSFKKLDID